MKWKQLWWAILACYIVGQLVSIPVAVLWAVSITRADRKPNITQTVTIEQQTSEVRTDLANKAYGEIMNGMRRGSSDSGELSGRFGYAGVRGVDTQRIADE